MTCDSTVTHVGEAKVSAVRMQSGHASGRPVQSHCKLSSSEQVTDLDEQLASIVGQLIASAQQARAIGIALG